MAIVLPAFAAHSIDRAAEVLRAGGIVIFPTDTVYGIAGALDHPEAIEALYAAKERPPTKPIALLIDRIEDLPLVCSAMSPAAKLLAERFWPGGLTLVLPALDSVPAIVTAGGPTVAVRLPNHPVPRAIARRLGLPLPTTSANRSNEPSPVTAEEAIRQLGAHVALVLDGGRCPGGIDSTVVDPCQVPPLVLREGAISAADIANALGGPVAKAGAG